MRHASADARRRRMVVAGALAALAATTWIVAYRYVVGVQLGPALAIYLVIVTVMVASVAAPGVSFSRLAPARGRVLCVIPAFNESAAALHATIDSLLAQSVEVAEIHVVDDGSAEPIEPYPAHPRVFWHRQDNGGKRQAQALVLREVRADHARGVHRADYVLTVDSDGTLDRHAVRHLLKAMADSRIQAATGLPLTRNTDQGWLPGLIDLEVTSICMTYRAARSHMGSQTTCSGALSLYRAGVILDHLEDYVDDPNAGDDRRLTHYALLRGRVVSVTEAVVHTDMPTTLRQLYKQRVRWSTSHWYYTPWEIRHLGREAAAWTIYNLVLSVLVPISLVWIILIDPLLGAGGPWTALGYWAICCWLLTLRYPVARPGMSATRRWATWAIGTPLLILLQILIMRPAMIHALLRVRSTSWGTRGPAALTALSAEQWLADLADQQEEVHVNEPNRALAVTAAPSVKATGAPTTPRPPLPRRPRCSDHQPTEQVWPGRLLTTTERAGLARVAAGLQRQLTR